MKSDSSPIAPPAGSAPSVARRAVPDDAVIAMRSAPDGWPLRSINWSPPIGAQRGSILFVGGRGDHFEKYYESFADWRERGWQVESFDWRGQGGSGRMTSDPVVGHADDFRVWIDDIGAYWADWRMRTPGPHVIIGHSMGGHLLLRALADGVVRPDAAVLIAPMLGFTAPYPDRLGLFVATCMVRLTMPDKAAWKVSEKPGTPLKARQMLLTHDKSRYADEQWWRDRMPELVIGPASWQWVAAAYTSFLHLKQPGLLAAVETPVLTLISGADKLVSPRAARKQVDRLANGQRHVYGSEAAHELLREADMVRDDALARIDAFLDTVVPA